MSHRYHYRPCPANHPFLLSAERVANPVASLPSSVDLRQFCKPIRDQGQEGCCSGFSTAAFREVSAAIAGTPLADYLSPAYLYARTRILEGTFPQDSGATIADEFSTLANYGVCPEHCLPYDQDPSETFDTQTDVAALPYRFAAPQSVYLNQNTLQGILASQQAITIGFTVFQSFEDTGANGVVPMPSFDTERVLGGHGVLLVGYTSFGWIIRNEWSASWGDAGYCYMPFGYEQTFCEGWTGPALGVTNQIKTIAERRSA